MEKWKIFVLILFPRNYRDIWNISSARDNISSYIELNNRYEWSARLNLLSVSTIMNYHNEIRAEVDIVMSVTRYSNDETEIVGHR